MLWDCVKLPLQPPNAILMLAPGRLHPYSPRRPLTEAHRPHARRAVKAIDAPAYDPVRDGFRSNPCARSYRRRDGGRPEWGWKTSAAILFGPPSIALAQ